MNKKVVIIAEAGVNHNGSIDLAKKLIDVAADSGADYIKFQTFKAEKLVTKNAKKAEYQIVNTEFKNDSQFDMLKNLEIPLHWYDELISYSFEKNIKFLSTGFDEESIDLLESYKIDLYKIPSGEITNKPYLEHIAKKGKSIILSTGMATLDEIRDALNIFYKYGIEKSRVTVLHCNTEYPTPMKDVNLLAMNHIKSEFNIEVGYSDHTLGIEVPIAAVSLGATVIEKHITLDKNMEGPDHIASLEPNELKMMVQSIRNIEKALGKGFKSPSESELKNKNIARKSIVASCEIRKGDVFTPNNITTKRPGTGISPMLWDEIIGKSAIRNFICDELIEI